MTPAATATTPTMAMWAQSTGPGMNVNGIIDQSDIQGIMATSESTGTASEAAAAGTNAGAVVSASCFDSFQGDGVCNSSATVAVTASATAASAARAVMTHEQLEVLRRQICVYAAICNQLIEMHKQSLTHPSTITGFRPMAFDSMMAMPGHKMTARQRWTPTQMQLQRLESIFEEGNGTPSKQKIKDITQELMHFGSISETNVYNWFQNRRARTKRKQQQISSSCNAAESEIETDIESPLDKKGKIELHSNQEGTRQSDGFHCSDVVTEQHHFESQRHGSALAFCQHMDQKPLINFGRIQSYEEGLTSSRYGQFNEMDEPMDNFSSINGMEAYPMASAMSDIGLQQNFPEALFRHTNIEQQHTSTVLQYLQRRDTEN